VILVDTNVLVGLVDHEDDLHVRASRDLRRLRRGPFGVTSAVLAECVFLLPEAHLLERLAFLLRRLPFSPVELPAPWWQAVFGWIARYADHEPDLADAQLVLLASTTSNARIWTYDREFRTTWRTPDGDAPPLAVRVD
jgi:predicted nucleic acid-binding protein